MLGCSPSASPSHSLYFQNMDYEFGAQQFQQNRFKYECVVHAWIGFHQQNGNFSFVSCQGKGQKFIWCAIECRLGQNFSVLCPTVPHRHTHTLEKRPRGRQSNSIQKSWFICGSLCEMSKKLAGGVHATVAFRSRRPLNAQVHTKCKISRFYLFCRSLSRIASHHRMHKMKFIKFAFASNYVRYEIRNEKKRKEKRKQKQK